MGTSSSYGGPGGRTPLLPPWAEEPGNGAHPGDQAAPPPGGEEQGEPAPTPVVPEVTWRAPKRVLSRLARGGGGGGAPTGGLRALGRAGSGVRRA
jgi:hypothetical protein